MTLLFGHAYTADRTLPTRALRDCSFDLRAGEVHAILGENGSGKSTLVKILTGIYDADAGSIEVGGRTVGRVGSPREAFALGVATVFQEILVVPPRSILDNVWLGTEGFLCDPLPAAEKQERARHVLAELLGEPRPLRIPAEALSLSDRQAVCIARALVREPRILILDEATSALDVATRDRLFAVLRRLCGEGVAVVFISHRMDEIEEIGDRITTMRSGTTVATVERGAASAAELVRLMTGAEHLTADAGEEAARHEPGGVVLSVAGLRLRPDSTPIDLEVRAGELVGLAGLEGHGQDAFLQALRTGGGAGGMIRVERGGRLLRIGSASDARRAGLAYVPRERKLEALFESLVIRENFSLPTLRRDALGGALIRTRSSSRRFRAYVERLGIRLASPRDRITTLSGGNQQKVVMARWLAAEPRILLLNDPTRGVDIGAKRDIYDLLVELTRQGIAVVMLSTEVDEHVELMDRVLVFRELELFCELPRAELSRERLIAAYFGRREDAPRAEAGAGVERG